MRQVSSFDELADLRARIAALPATNAKIAERVADRFSDLARAAFDSQSSVYGAPFGQGSSGQPLDLHESGRMRSQAVNFTATGTTIRASVASVKYARYQLKHGILPRRGALPAEWASELRRIAREELDKAVRL